MSKTIFGVFLCIVLSVSALLARPAAACEAFFYCYADEREYSENWRRFVSGVFSGDIRKGKIYAGEFAFWLAENYEGIPAPFNLVFNCEEDETRDGAHGLRAELIGVDKAHGIPVVETDWTKTKE